MDDERIFGPLTLRQFIYAAVAAMIVYLAYGQLERAVSIPIAIAVIAAAFSLIRRAEPPPFNEEYVRRKRAELGPEGFGLWLQKKVASILSQQEMRAQRGLSPDPKLAEAIELMKRVAGAN